MRARALMNLLAYSPKTRGSAVVAFSEVTEEPYVSAGAAGVPAGGRGGRRRMTRGQGGHLSTRFSLHPTPVPFRLFYRTADGPRVDFWNRAKSMGQGGLTLEKISALEPFHNE